MIGVVSLLCFVICYPFLSLFSPPLVIKLSDSDSRIENWVVVRFEIVEIKRRNFKKFELGLFYLLRFVLFQSDIVFRWLFVVGLLQIQV